MTSERIAIITPSFERDFELCKTLNRSVLEFLPSNVKHYIFVDRRDLRQFRPLGGDRTLVMSKEEVMPKGIVQVPGFNRWFSTATLLPLHGWLVQQIAKIATASLLDEPTLVMVDSDAFFVRDVDPAIFAHDGQTRLYQSPGAITAAMTSHIEWHRNACRLLGVPAASLPLDDYIGQVISWNTSLVLQMCARVEAVAGTNWYTAIARARQFSEYLLYGLFVDRIAGIAGNVWLDGHSRCNSRWESAAIPSEEMTTFVQSLGVDDIALMISSHSRTTPAARRLAIALATNGRLD